MSSRTRVKICGITRLEDAQAAMAAGADALGFVFYLPSPRFITPEAAASLIRQLPPFVSCVGLVVNPSANDVQQLLQTVPLDLLQFHGEETDAFCEQFGKPWIKALAMKPDEDMLALAGRYPHARALLLDAWHPDLKGGTGHTFDWSRIPSLPKPFILAGGLNSANVAEAIAATHPFAVDVSGGVEQSKGIKSASLINSFIAAVNAGDSVA